MILLGQFYPANANLLTSQQFASFPYDGAFNVDHINVYDHSIVHSVSVFRLYLLWLPWSDIIHNVSSRWSRSNVSLHYQNSCRFLFEFRLLHTLISLLNCPWKSRQNSSELCKIFFGLENLSSTQGKRIFFKANTKTVFWIKFCV